MTDFEQAIKTAAEKSILQIISEGNWIVPDYRNRFTMPLEMLTDIWKLVDVEKLKKNMAERLESELADRIMSHMAAEIATDIKQILSVKERRESLRSIAREHMDKIMQAGLEVKHLRAPPPAGYTLVYEGLRQDSDLRWSHFEGKWTPVFSVGMSNRIEDFEFPCARKEEK